MNKQTVASNAKKGPGVKIKGLVPKFFEENEFKTLQIVSETKVSQSLFKTL